MRIGMFTDAYLPIISGVTVSISNLAKELRKLGHTVYIITNEHDKADIDEFVVRIPGITFPMKGMEEFKFSKVTSKKTKVFEDLNLDVIHCHTEFTMGRLGRKTAHLNNIPIVHTYHTMYEDYIHFITKIFHYPLKKMSKVYSKKFASSVDEVIFPTVKVRDVFKRYGYEGNYHIIPSGIYLDKFKKENFSKEELFELRSSLNIAENDLVLLFLGRVSKEKSINDLITNFEKISKKHNDVKLLIVGGGPDREELEQLAKDKNIFDKVIFTGMINIDDVPKYYNVADLFVNFSNTETQGLTYIEALASSLPLLVRYDSNLEGVIDDDINGYAFNESSEFVNLFEKIYSDRNLLNTLTENAINTAQDFSAENYAKNVEKIYKKFV